MNWFVTSLRENPELAIFLTLAVGFVIGRARIGSFRLGNVVGTLLAGVLVGQLDVKIDPLVKTVFFALFLFATGYKVGPQFFRGLKKNAASQALLTLVLCVVSLVTTVVAAKVMGYDAGTAAGLLAGAFTESTVIGTAGNTISRLGLPEAETTRLLNNIPVAYAVSYLVGTSFVVWFLSSLAPRLLGVNLKEESRKLEAQAAGGAKPEDGVRSAYREWDVRAFRIPRCVGRAPRGRRRGLVRSRPGLPAERRGAGGPSSISPRTSCCRRATWWWRARAVTCCSRRAVPSARRWRTASCSTSRWPPSTSSSRGARWPSGRSRSSPRSTAAVSSSSSSSAPGEEIPFAPDTIVNRGDLLRLAGSQQDVERVGQGDRLRRAAVERDGRGVRGPRDPPRWALRRADPPDRRPADQPHRERRRAHHGARLRLAALGAPHLRAHPGARPLDLRHDRPRRLHRLRGPRRGPELRRRPAHDRARASSS